VGGGISHDVYGEMATGMHDFTRVHRTGPLSPSRMGTARLWWMRVWGLRLSIQFSVSSVQCSGFGVWGVGSIV